MISHRPFIAPLPACALALLLASGCARSIRPAASTHETLLAIVNEYQLFQGVDIYRNPFPQDLTGQNAARATLVRLANYENLYPGRFTPEIEMLRGRIFADLGDYAAAAGHFLQCAGYDTPLRPVARESAEIADAFQAVLAHSVQSKDLESFLADRERQIADLQALAGQYKATRWETLARIERESLEIERAELLDANQFAIPAGAERARLAFEQLVANHADSRRALAHALRLARFHIDQARLLERLRDPERGAFDLNVFSSHLEIALDILHRVSQADGHPEKTVARHQLDETLAYSELVRARAR